MTRTYNRRLWVLATFLLTLLKTSHGQVKAGQLDSLLQRYSVCTTDTGKISLLLRIDSIYCFKLPNTRAAIDSSISIARTIRQLGQNTRNQKAYEDGTLIEAKALAKRKDIPRVRQIINSSTGGLKICLLQDLAEHYLFRPGELKENLDSSYPFIRQAVSLSDSLHLEKWIVESTCLLGKYYYSTGNIAEGKKCFLSIIEGFRQTGDKSAEAHWWDELGNYIPDTDSTYADEVNAFQRSRDMYRLLGNKNEERSVLLHLAYIQQRHGEIDLAEKEFFEMLRLAKEVGNKNLWRAYIPLSGINLARGDYNKGLYYAREGVNSVESSGEYNFRGIAWFQLAEAYRVLGQTQNSLDSYQTALDGLVARRAHFLYAIMGKITGLMLQQSRPADALAFLKEHIKKDPPVRFEDKEIVAAAIGNCYDALGNYPAAEKKYQEMMALDSMEEMHRNKEPFPDNDGANVTTSAANLLIGKFYVKQQKFQLAKPFLTRSLTDKLFTPPLEQLRDAYLLLFKADSSLGNSNLAIREYQAATALNDSIYTIAKSRQIQEMLIKYATEKKEQDLNVLRAQQQTQTKDLQRTAQARNYTYAVVLILLALVGVVYSRYRLKQKNNRQLQTLVREKEWLVKEIHHRVKNNLQMIISLLNTQSKYLDTHAFRAVQDSKTRMQAIALIHQRLYQPDQQHADINMKEYIEELTGHLQQSFGDSTRVHFDLQLQNIRLDIAQAVPLGLILNETITNSLKYAFPEDSPGKITISLHADPETTISMTISDNGCGFPPNLAPSETRSLGLQLIQLLAEQLDANLTINSKQGVSITLVFQQLISSQTSPSVSRAS